MRVCVFTSDMDSAPLDRATLLAKSNCTIEQEKVEAIYIVSHRCPKSRLDGNRYYIFNGHDSFKVKLCRRFLRVLDANRVIPAFVAQLPLRLCENEIVEVLLACDPDAIAVLNVRWGNHLQKLVQRIYPQWVCSAETKKTLDSDRQWRQYDPSVKVSIVLPTYNGSQYIRQSIESCLNQTFRNMELIIVDDGSTADITRIVNSHNDSRLRYIRHETNLGLPAALNTGFRHCTGEYLTWTSDDNYYAESAIEEMARFLQTYSEIDFVYADNYIVDERKRDQRCRIQRNKPPVSLRVNNYIGGCFLYRRKVYETIGEYNSRAFLAEDYDYWVRVSKRFRMQRLFRPLYYYRFHPDSLTANYSREQVAEKVEMVKQWNGVELKTNNSTVKLKAALKTLLYR